MDGIFWAAPKLATGLRPRGGDWLADDVARWRQAGVGRVLSLLTREEQIELELTQEGAHCLAQGIGFWPFPIPDYSVPPNGAALERLIADAHTAWQSGESLLIHCRQGIGRSSTIAAAILVHGGVPGPEALAQITRARGRPVPDTEAQQRWILARSSGK